MTIFHVFGETNNKNLIINEVDKMVFEYYSEGKILYGMPYVAKVSINKYINELEYTYYEFEVSTNTLGDVEVFGDYEAENFDILQIRNGCFTMEDLPAYYLVYKNKLINLGLYQDERLEVQIKLFLTNCITVCELLDKIEDILKEQYSEEISEIFSNESMKKGNSKTKRENNIQILKTIKEFVRYGREYVNIQYNDYYTITNSIHQKVRFCRLFDSNLYIETNDMKINLQEDKVINYDVLKQGKDIFKIEVDLEGEAKIIFSESR